MKYKILKYIIVFKNTQHQFMPAWPFLSFMDYHKESMVITNETSEGGVHSTLVVSCTAGQQVKWSILYHVHDS